MGEAAGKVSQDFRQSHPEIPWPKVIGMRHRLIHGYNDVDIDIVWQVVTAELPPLIEALDRLIPPDTSQGGV